jgi:putative hydrolase of HD superfamily
MNDNEATELMKYFFELGVLKNYKRSGWWVAGVKDPETIAEHSFRTAVIAFILAKLEKRSEAKEIAVSALFHDVCETRLLDMHKISSAYFKIPKEIEEKVVGDQTERLPVEIRNEFRELITDTKHRDILKDADYLEVAIQAKEYYDLGYHEAWDWVERVGQVLKTNSAKRLHARMKKMKASSWWKGLKEDVKKLKY